MVAVGGRDAKAPLATASHTVLPHRKLDPALAMRQNGTPAPQPLFAFVTLYSGDKKLLETAPTAIVPNGSSRLGTMPLSFDLGMDQLPRGEYDCQVTVLDPATQKAAFWRASIVLAL